jgi:DNA-directed RNA polymerase specialized sigma24 family protein
VTHEAPAAVVRQAQSGDHAAFEELVILLEDRAFALAYRVVRSRTIAEDAVQQALLNAWRDLPRLREPERFEAWVYRLLVRACYAELRRNDFASRLRFLTTSPKLTPQVPQTIGTRWIGPSRASARTGGRSSCSTTTAVSPSPRLRRSSESRRAP